MRLWKPPLVRFPDPDLWYVTITCICMLLSILSSLVYSTIEFSFFIVFRVVQRKFIKNLKITHSVEHWKGKFEKLALPSPIAGAYFIYLYVSFKWLLVMALTFTHASIGEGDPSRTDAKQGDEKRWWKTSESVRCILVPEALHTFWVNSLLSNKKLKFILSLF